MLTPLLLAALAIVPSSQHDTKAPPQLDCIVVLTADTNSDDRLNCTLPDEVPDITRTSAVVHEQWFTVDIFSSAMAAGKDGSARVREDLRVTKPDGSLYFEAKDLEAFSGAVPPGALQFGLAAPRISFDPPDPLGKYKVVVTLHDEIAKTSISSESTIELVQYKDEGNFEKQGAVGEWINEYVRSPKPKEAVNAFLTHARAGLWASHTNEVFFREVFALNTFLPRALAAHYATEKPPVREAILELLAPIAFEKEKFNAALSPAERAKFEALAARPLRDVLADPVSEPAHVDMLWQHFQATGKVAPIHRLCELLEPAPAAPASMTAADKDARARAELVRKSARESIKRGAAEYKLVLAYCEWMLVNGDLPQAAREELTKVIAG